MKTPRELMEQTVPQLRHIAAASVVAYLLAFPNLFWLLVLFMIADVLLGLTVAARKRKLNGSKMLDGGLKKAAVLIATIAIITADVYIIPRVVGRVNPVGFGEFSLGGATAGYFAVQELMSMARHMAAHEAPLPSFAVEFIRKLIDQLYDPEYHNGSDDTQHDNDAST